MKMLRWLTLATVFLISAPVGLTQLLDVRITAQKKRMDRQKDRSGGNVTVTVDEISYSVSVQNKRFQAQPQVVVKYAVYMEDSKVGSTAKAVTKAIRGEETLKDIAANATVTFDTKPIKLSKEELDAGWYHPSGASSQSRDRVQGIWIRAYDVAGKLLGEYANPSTISKKNEWKD
jgi:hypothetical protein